MKILAIDTSLGSISLTIEINGFRYSTDVIQYNQQSKLLATTLTDLMHQAGLIDVNEFDFILLTRGPGSFTGVRIGIAFILGLKSLIKCPILTCSSLNCLDINYPEKSLATLNAGQNNFYTQYFDKNIGIEPIKTMSLSEINLLNDMEIIGHYSNSAIKISSVKMLTLFNNLDIRDIIFSDRLEPLYVRSTYF